MNRTELLRKYIQQESIINLIDVQIQYDEDENEFIRIIPSDILTEIPEIEEKLNKLPYHYNLIFRDSDYTNSNYVGYTHVFDLYLLPERNIEQKLIFIARELREGNNGLGALFD